jgi:hypothetical protein
LLSYAGFGADLVHKALELLDLLGGPFFYGETGMDQDMIANLRVRRERQIAFAPGAVHVNDSQAILVFFDYQRWHG